MTGPLAERLSQYDALGNEWSFYHPAEACFSRHVFPRIEARARALIDALPPSPVRDQLDHLWDRADRYIDECLDEVPWQEYAVAGLSSTFNQNLASLLLARRLRERWPHLKIVFGGSNAEGEMGEEIARSFPELDHVFSGDSDRSFPAYVQATLSGAAPDEIPGLISRDAAGRVSATPAQVIADLDALAYPDFDDYFAQREASGLEAHPPLAAARTIPFESSRGCWWGAKHHCTFCGLNGYGMAFRAKSVPRFISEIEHLAARYRPRRVCAMDNIMDYRYFREALGKLRDLGLDLTASYEVKSNLRREHVTLLAEAGVREIEAGVESLSTPALARMKKGVTAIQNVQTMRLCRELGVKLNWQHLYGFPGETWEDYAHIPRAAPLLFHLEPPTSQDTMRVSLQRYSPYFTAPESYRITGVRPAESYADLYDLDPAALSRIAYRFEFDLAEDVPRSAGAIREGVTPVLARWRQRDHAGADLALFRGEGGALVIDTRLEVARAWRLDHAALAMLDRADEIAGITKLVAAALEATPAPGPDLRPFVEKLAARGLSAQPIGLRGSCPDRAAAESLADSLLGAGLIFREGNQYATLPIPRDLSVLAHALNGPSPPSSDGGR
jgi:ribosomal peptide maturation radical SAM protein 1